MAKTGVNKAHIRRTESHTDHPTIDPATMEPGCLREWFLSALAVLPPDEWDEVRDKVLNRLGEAGINLGACMLVLGIPARDPEELTPPELAMLIRYVRINTPKALMGLSEQLIQLERIRHETRAELTRRAA
jgi:hypothetical protein